MQKLSPTAIFISLFLCFPLLAQQNAIIELRGRVVEVSNGKSIGIPGIKVSVIGGNYDITVKNGEFKLIVPTGKDYVKILIDNTDKKLLKPYAGFVNLPPSGNLDIIVCAQENRKLQAKVNDLNAQIQRLENKNELSKKQLVAMHSEMLDTILHYEQIIQGLIASGWDSAEVRLLTEKLVSRRDEMIKDLKLTGEIPLLRPEGARRNVSYDPATEGPIVITVPTGQKIAAPVSDRKIVAGRLQRSADR